MFEGDNYIMTDSLDQKSLDLTNEETVAAQDETKPIEEKEYDSRPQEDSARRRIAYILLGLLGFVLGWALLTVSIVPESVYDVTDVLQIVLGPIIALVSAATGFYFGSKSN